MCSNFTNGSNWLQLGPPKIRISYFVPSLLRGERWREGERKNVGLEANPNLSCGKGVSGANASEGGRLRGKSEARGEKESQCLRQCNQIEN